MRDFERKLITEWRRLELPMSESAVVIAVSGGADSISLLIAADEIRKLGKLPVRIIAAHFDHQLRGDESDADEAFVRELCIERKIELAVGRSRVKPTSDIEQNARNERYDFIRKTAENLKASIALTGHTIDDQAETFLLNLIRGSGVTGLAGMRPVRRLTIDDSATALARPFLRWARRSDTEAYCRELGVKYRSDTMNEDESFTRVRVRKVLIPLLLDFNPKIIERLADTARLLGQEINPASAEVTGEALKLTELKKMTEAELSKQLRSWIAVNRGDLRQIELKHIDALSRFINSRKSGKTVELPGGDTVVKQGGRLVFNKNNVEKTGSDI